MYRALVPYGFGKLVHRAKGGDVINTNIKRVVETWFDEERKEYFFTGSHWPGILTMGTNQIC